MSIDPETRPILVVFDTSAIVDSPASRSTSARCSPKSPPKGAAAIPVACLVEAERWVADNDRLDLLIQHDASVLTADDPADWRLLAVMHDIVGRLDATSAAFVAFDSRCAVLTRQPGIYAGLADGGPAIPIDD